MSGGLLRRFLENLGKVPEEKPPIIPERWRIPFFISLSVLALMLLLLLLWLVVVPGIRAQRAAVAASALPRQALSI